MIFHFSDEKNKFREIMFRLAQLLTDKVGIPTKSVTFYLTFKKN